MRSINRLEKKYGIKIVEVKHWNPCLEKWEKHYKVFSADGRLYDWVGSFDGVKKVCGEWGHRLVAIKRREAADVSGS